MTKLLLKCNIKTTNYNMVIFKIYSSTNIISKTDFKAILFSIILN